MNNVLAKMKSTDIPIVSILLVLIGTLGIIIHKNNEQNLKG